MEPEKPSAKTGEPLPLPSTSKGTKRKGLVERAEAKRKYEQSRSQRKIYIGESYERWKKLRNDLGLKTDAETAEYLLNRAEREEETPSKHQDNDTFEPPDEGDLTRKSACIAYEECLRKLGTFLQLPILKCPHVDPITQTECGCCSPFQVEIGRKGTAFIMEWFCSRGHRLWEWNSQPLLKFGMQSGDLMLSSSILLSGNTYPKVALLFKQMNMGMAVDTKRYSFQNASMKDFWEEKQAEVLARLKEKNSLTDREFPSDIQELQIKEEPSWLQEETKEEQDETSEAVQDGEHLQDLEEADPTTLPFNIVAVKSEDDEERNQIETEEDCPDPESFSAPEIEVKIEDSSEPDTDDSDECPWTTQKQSDLNFDELYNCSVCGETFNSLESLIRHKVVHTGEKPFCCSDCGKRFTLKHHLIRHRIVHTGEKPFTCSDCGKRFTQKSDLNYHMANHTGEKLFSCSECGKSFNRKQDLMVHMPQHSKLKLFSCSECGKRYADKRRLARHIRTHVEGKPFSCSECEKQFKEKSLLIRHMMIHTGEKPFSCSDCGKTFNQKSSLTRHIMSHTGEKTLSCTECGKQFKNKYILTEHMRVHTGEKPFSCNECGKRFGRRFYLKSHMALHREEKPYSCSECGKGFNQKSGLTTHMEYHRKEKLFSCSDCGKRYTVKRSLDRHILVHTGERPFSCSVCSKTFKQQAHLISHMPVHTEKKPYSCSECSKRFYRKWHLTSHMLVHTGGREKRYSCSVCEKRFSFCSQLKKHECVSAQVSELQQKQTEEKEKAEMKGEGVRCMGKLDGRSADVERLLQPEDEIKTEFNAP